MSIIFDLLITTYTGYHSFLFLIVLNHKNIYLLLFCGLLIDFIIGDTFGLITLILLFLYYANAHIKDFYLQTIFNYFFTLIILKISFSLAGFVIYFLFIYLRNNVYN